MAYSRGHFGERVGNIIAKNDEVEFKYWTPCKLLNNGELKFGNREAVFTMSQDKYGKSKATLEKVFSRKDLDGIAVKNGKVRIRVPLDRNYLFTMYSRIYLGLKNNCDNQDIDIVVSAESDFPVEQFLRLIFEVIVSGEGQLSKQLSNNDIMSKLVNVVKPKNHIDESVLSNSEPDEENDLQDVVTPSSDFAIFWKVFCVDLSKLLILKRTDLYALSVAASNFIEYVWLNGYLGDKRWSMIPQALVSAVCFGKDVVCVGVGSCKAKKGCDKRGHILVARSLVECALDLGKFGGALFGALYNGCFWGGVSKAFALGLNTVDDLAHTLVFETADQLKLSLKHNNLFCFFPTIFKLSASGSDLISMCGFIYTAVIYCAEEEPSLFEQIIPLLIMAWIVAKTSISYVSNFTIGAVKVHDEIIGDGDTKNRVHPEPEEPEVQADRVLTHTT